MSQIEIDNKECLIPCEGLYADVTKIVPNNIDQENYEKLHKDYNKYKRSFDLSKSIKMNNSSELSCNHKDIMQNIFFDSAVLL